MEPIIAVLLLAAAALPALHTAVAAPATPASIAQTFTGDGTAYSQAVAQWGGMRNFNCQASLGVLSDYQ